MSRLANFDGQMDKLSNASSSAEGCNGVRHRVFRKDIVMLSSCLIISSVTHVAEGVTGTVVMRLDSDDSERDWAARLILVVAS
jgi:hypothetical protein